MSLKKLKAFVFVFAVVLILNLITINTATGLDIKYGYFPDVADNHWAKQVITKMNLRNVVGGYEENGLRVFKPDKPVNQLEAVIMAIRTMGLAAREAEIDTNRQLPFSVPEWAKAPVIIAFDEGIISDSSFQYNEEAKRAWVAKLLVMMIDKEEELTQVQNEILPYSDSFNIPDEYVNYVKVANKYGLIKGNVDNTFRPNETVTRAQLVAFLSRAEKYLDLKADNVITGKIKTINGTNIVVEDDNGEEYTLICNISTNLYGKNGEEIWLGDLEENERVYLIVDGNLIQYLDMNAPEPQFTFKTGEILQVYEEENTIVIKNSKEKIDTINLSAGTEIINEDNEKVNLNQLTKGTEIKIQLNEKGDPIKIILVANTVSSTGDGIVYDIDRDLKLVTLKKDDGLTAYLYNDNTVISIENNRFATIEDIKIGDEVEIEASEEVLEKITLLKTEVELSVSGIVKQISINERIITIQTDGNQLKAFYVNPDAAVNFSGEAGDLEDILIGDVLELKVEEGKVVKIEVENRKLHENSKGFVVGVDYSNRILTIKDSQNELHAYEVSSSADIYVNEDDAYLHEVKKDMQVEIQLDEDKITYLSAKNTLLGTIDEVNDKTNIIELTLETGEKRTYTVDSDVDIDIEDEGSSELDDIHSGDNVEIKVENSKITDINVQRQITYKIIDTYDNSSKIKVIDEDNDTHYLYLYSRVDLEIPGKTDADVDDLKVNDIIKATYLGYTLQKVEVAPLVIASVTSIDTSNNTISIRTFDGQDYTYNFDNSCQITKKGYNYYHLGVLSLGDRVAIEENLEGGKVFNILNKISGKIGAIYKDKTRLYLQITQTTWQKYDMIPTAYLHQGSVLLTPSEIKLNDEVDIYLVDDKVYEVEKK